MTYRLCFVCSVMLTIYTLGCSTWAITAWPVALIWRSLAALLLILVVCWPVLVRLFFTLAATKPTGPRGRAYTVWLVAHALTTGRVLPQLVNALGTLIVVGSVLLDALALVAAHPLLVPLAVTPLALRDPFCAWMLRHLAASNPLEGER